MTPTFRKRLSFGRFVLLTAGIGAASGLIISLVVLEFDPGQIVMLVVSTAFGGVLGLVMGIPAEFAVRLAAPRPRSRVGAVLCLLRPRSRLRARRPEHPRNDHPGSG